MELVFCEAKKRLFKKKLGDNFFENHSKMSDGDRFLKFWSLAFESSEKPKDVIGFLNISESYLDDGPARKWISWLTNKFILFMWADSDLNLIDLCTELNLKDKSFRDYLFFLASEDGYSNNFFLKEEIAINNTRFDEFKVFFTDEKFSNDRLATLELSLFPSWYKLLDDLEKDVTSKTLKRTGSFLKYFIGYFSTLSFGVVIIFFFIFTSSMEAERILKKLTISIPSFENIDSLNTFDEPVTSNFVAEEDFKFDEKIEVLDDSERFDTESEIEFVDYEKIKTHFSALGREKTEFEEETKGVFREARYGYSTVYRIMIETSDSYSFLNDFKKLKKRFTFEKAGKVEPGLFIPGGNYFNLLVSSDKFGDVLKELQKYRPMIYASRSKGRKIPGKTKVFIFLSKI